MIDVDENGDMNDVVMNTTTTSATTDSNNANNNNNANWVGDQPMKNEGTTVSGNVKGAKTAAVKGDKKDKS